MYMCVYIYIYIHNIMSISYTIVAVRAAAPLATVAGAEHAGGA